MTYSRSDCTLHKSTTSKEHLTYLQREVSNNIIVAILVIKCNAAIIVFKHDDNDRVWKLGFKKKNTSEASNLIIVVVVVHEKLVWVIN